ncbi:PASTA domain-containing protein [Actinoallomurus sp. NBC_01490]|uniref:PASTA domain-containing protein n=1 Tax=Actinoallomurus sp. NBC_01490 TaxID=2903557 RepID=UPI002E35C5A4|nr:PASTA domain-containing protein [Actinoallomurus sp. NBC_01490]
MPSLPITLFVVACVSLLPTGCRSHQEPNSASGVSRSSPTATADAHPNPKRFDPKPRTAEEKKYDKEIRSNLDPAAEKKFDNIYWGTRSYKGLHIEDGQARVAIDSKLHIPAATLRGLAKWFGNMAGDPQGIPKYRWILVDYRSGSQVKISADPEKLVRMPDLVGKYGNAAVGTLQANGISTNHITWKSVTGKGVWLKSNWRVVAQNPSAGSKVNNKNAVIILLVAK